MKMSWVLFGGMALLGFLVFAILGGIFVIYFGNSRSRIKGLLTLVVGLITLFIFIWFTWKPGVIPWEAPSLWNQEVILEGISAFVGAVLGILAGIGAIILSILKR